MDKLTFSATCLLGLEGLVSNDLKFMGIKNVRAENGRVLFDGDYNTLALSNICSRYNERVLILLSEFNAVSFEQLFCGVESIEWERFLNIDDAFPVAGRSISSQLKSIPNCQKIIKKAVVERLKTKYKTSWFEETGAVHQIRFLIMKDRVSIMLDTSGAGLHKRGYREFSNDAPIRETLACAMAELARVRANHTVIDPMCGSGTLLIESALKAMKIAPGINRSFAAESWAQIPKEVWTYQRERAREAENRDCAFEAFGYDIDESALKIAKRNAEMAGVGNRIHFEKRDIRDFSAEFERATIIVNPPYGERLLDVKQAEELYKIMGEKFVHRHGYSYTVISPDDDFEKCFGRKAKKRRKLYNGMLKCQVYMYY